MLGDAVAGVGDPDCTAEGEAEAAPEVDTGGAAVGDWLTEPGDAVAEIGEELGLA